jgi:hypothetical protein
MSNWTFVLESPPLSPISSERKQDEYQPPGTPDNQQVNPLAAKQWKFTGSRSKVHKVGVHFDKHSEYLGNWGSTTRSGRSKRAKEKQIHTASNPDLGLQDVPLRPKIHIQRHQSTPSGYRYTVPQLPNHSRNSMNYVADVIQPTQPDIPRFQRSYSMENGLAYPVVEQTQMAPSGFPSPVYSYTSPGNTHASPPVSPGHFPRHHHYSPYPQPVPGLPEVFQPNYQPPN